MADPSGLLAVARLLLQHEDDGPPPDDARLRRAVSTAYYALFHTVLRAAADRFIGRDAVMSGGYAAIYRGFDHRHMKAVCEALRASTPPQRVRRYLRDETVSREIRSFAGNFLELQEARHAADYDPAATFALSDVEDLIQIAVSAMEAFDAVATEEKSDILALLMVRARD